MSQINKTYPLTAVGIGPGDPDLISLKGYKALQNAGVVFYPVSAMGEKGEKSFSRKILDAYELAAELRPLHFPMNGRNRMEFYRKAYAQIRDEWVKGTRVAVVSEGDLLFYSTFGYLLELANADGVPCELVPGIPAFILGGAVAARSLVDGRQRFGILPGPKTFEQIGQQLQTNEVLVIMKPSIIKKGWDEFLKKCGRPFFYAEKLGTADQYTTTSAEAMCERKVPYFSVIIFRPAEGEEKECAR